MMGGSGGGRPRAESKVIDEEYLKESIEKERQILMKRAAEDMKELIEQNSKTQKEREDLAVELERKANILSEAAGEKQELMEKIKEMEEKLMTGGEMLDQAQKQEILFRKAQQDLEKQRQQEMMLKRTLQDQEEENLNLEQQYSGLQEEVEIKTKKLKKLWSKYKSVQQEVEDVSSEFQRERSDLLDTIRELSSQIKLKEMVISYFIPPDMARKIEKLAFYNEEYDQWELRGMGGRQSGRRRGGQEEEEGDSDYMGQVLYTRRPADPFSTENRDVSSFRKKMNRLSLSSPESDFSTQKRQYDANPRYRTENLTDLEYETPKELNQVFERAGDVVHLTLNDGRQDPTLNLTSQLMAKMLMEVQRNQLSSSSNTPPPPNPFVRYDGLPAEMYQPPSSFLKAHNVTSSSSRSESKSSSRRRSSKAK